MYPLKLRSVGTSTGMTLPKELLGKLRVAAGDTIFFTEAPGGTFRLTPYNPAFAAQIEIAERILREDRNLLHAVAK